MNPTPEQIRSTRRQAGLTQDECALLCQVSRVTWSRWERGKARGGTAMPFVTWHYFLTKLGHFN